MLCEITVTIKDEEKTLRSKYLNYEDISVDENDPIIKEYIGKTLDNFDGTPDSITVNIKMEIS